MRTNVNMESNDFQTGALLNYLCHSWNLPGGNPRTPGSAGAQPEQFKKQHTMLKYSLDLHS